MPIDLDDAFEIDSAIVGMDGNFSGIITIDFDPTVGGQAAPLGSFAMRTNGNHYRKIGAADTDWKLVEGPQFLPFCNRAGAAENIPIQGSPNFYLPFFNRAGASENIGII